MRDTVVLLLTIHLSLLILLFHLLTSNATSHNVVKSIPGFTGDLPFYLETGYVGVGENEEVQLFYYFVKSERDPAKDPLMLWLTGGPGCSAFSGFILEIGPLIFNTSACNWHSKFPTYQVNPYSWTKVASIIFLDWPAGAGFSYPTNQEGYYNNSDTTASKHIYQFLIKWLVDHAEFQNNPLYISGDSYGGKVAPIVVQEISDGNKAGIQPIMNLKGYVLGNPITRDEYEPEAKFEYARRMSLLSDELYQSTKISCNGSYDDEHLENVSCRRNLQAISYNLDPLYDPHVLLPKCISSRIWCKDSMYRLLDYWANDIQVQKALKIREGTKPYWIRCNKTLVYDENVGSVVGYHQYQTQDFMHALIYSGDQDLIVSYVGTVKWISMLNISITEDWRPWFVNDQVGGYTTRYSNGRFNLTYATVKGGGHTAPEYRSPECFTMLLKWFADSLYN